MSEILKSGGIVPARRRVPFSLSTGVDTLLLWLQRRRERRMLAALSEYMLKDIGVSRADVEAETRKTFWRR